VLDYVWLPVGEYKIYFIDDAYANLQNSNYWLHDSPIYISIVPDDNAGTTVTSKGSTYGSASISVKNNIFCQGADIVITYLANNLTTPNGDPWVAISKTIQQSTGLFDYYTHWAYTAKTDSGTVTYNKNTGNSPQDEVSSYKSLPIGGYKVHYVNGSNLISGINYVEPIGINITNAATLKATIGSTSLLNSDTPYDINKVQKTINVTAADVEKGYVTVSFSFSSLNTNVDYYLNVQNVSLVKQ
jgi:hypothetical protein